MGALVTASTATYAIVYATSTDALCDGADITEQMAESIETALSGVAADIARLTVIPYIVVAETASAPSAVNPAIITVPWDSVVADTDNFADFPTDGDPTMDWNPTQHPTGVYMNGFGFEGYSVSGVNFTTFEAKDVANILLSTVLQDQPAPSTFPGAMSEQGLVSLDSTHTSTQYTGQVVPNYAGSPSNSIVGSDTGTFAWFIWMRDIS